MPVPRGTGRKEARCRPAASISTRAATDDSDRDPRPPANPTTFVADPGPLGLAAFAGTTFVLSVFNSGMANDTGSAVVIGLALFYGGIGQLLAGMWEFRKNNTFGALAFTSYGAFWLSFAYLHPLHRPDHGEGRQPGARASTC